MFFLVIENIASCLLIALIGTIILCSICGMLPKWLNSSFSYTLQHYIILAVAFIILFVQLFMFSGVSYVKDYIHEVENGVVSINELVDKYPEVLEYADQYTSTDELKAQSQEIFGPIYSQLNSYLWKYAIGIFIVTLLLSIYFVIQVNTRQHKNSSRNRRSSTRRRRSYDF